MTPHFKSLTQLFVTLILVVLFAVYATGCTQLNALAVNEGDNAMACLRGNTGATAGMFAGDVSGVTIELPANTDTSDWTAEDWRLLAEICD